MEMEETAGALPEKKQRNPIIYAVAYSHPQTGALTITECDTRGDAKKFINDELKNPELVQKIYRVSGIIEMKQKTVISF